jgi:class 3 adenylate cyclase
VFKHGGTLDKYIGDALMVFFGDPIPYDDHASRAVKMALEMRARLAELRYQWSLGSEETLTVGMGISTGYLTVGNIGSPARMEYTVLGNHVNLASRLADRAKAGQILISERTLVATRHLVRSSWKVCHGQSRSTRSTSASCCPVVREWPMCSPKLPHP